MSKSETKVRSQDFLNWKAVNPVVELRKVAKSFYIYENRIGSIRELFIRLLKKRLKDGGEPHFSLNAISLTIPPGEIWALIGPNGSGKSTLLRLIAGIYWPSSGEIITRGRLAALIELGSGFHPELTGRENVYLYGNIIGLSKNEISQHYEDIVEFSGIREFMDMPVKYYSSGMRVRLGFSVACIIQPDILLLDDVLTVGDAEFRVQSYQRIRSFQSNGCTIVLATHDLSEAETFASRALWLDRGILHMQGTAKEVINAYKSSITR